MSAQKKYIAWSPDYGTEEDAININAAEWHGPREIATLWAEAYDITNAEYDIAIKEKTVQVMVKDCSTGITTEWIVTGEIIMRYSVYSIERN